MTSLADHTAAAAPAALRVPAHRQADLAAFEKDCLAQLAPRGLREMEAFSDFVRAAWHKREVIAAQNAFIESSPEAFLDNAVSRQLDRLHRYERDFERRAHRALSDLERIQSIRNRRPAVVAEESPVASAPLDLAADLRATLRMMEAEVNRWHTRDRAHKTGPPPETVAADSASPPS